VPSSDMLGRPTDVRSSPNIGLRLRHLGRRLSANFGLMQCTKILASQLLDGGSETVHQCRGGVVAASAVAVRLGGKLRNYLGPIASPLLRGM